MPVAAKNTSSPLTRSSVVSTRVDVVAVVDERCRSSSSRGYEASLDGTAEALERGGGDHPFGRAADAHSRSTPDPRGGGGDRARDVAVADQVHARAHASRMAAIMSCVAWPVEDRDADVLGPHALRLGDQPDVLLRRCGDVDDVCSLGAGRDLLHVDGRAREEHRAARRRARSPPQRWAGRGR